MSNRTQIEVYGKTYHIKSADGPIPAQELAQCVDAKMRELENATNRASTLDLAVLTALNLAQELFEAREALQHRQQGDAGNERDWRQRCDALTRQVEQFLSPPAKDAAK
ncbi:MAG: cell division protein ZapA [Nitrospinaceae bacterium]